MKKIILGILVFITISSCKKQEEKIIVNSSILETYFKNKTAQKWLNYYQNKDKNFKISDFEFKNEQVLNITKATIYGTFDKEFDKVYLPYLIYSPNKKMYLDIDSYCWVEYTEKGKKVKGFEPDQAICIANLETKKNRANWFLWFLKLGRRCVLVK